MPELAAHPCFSKLEPEQAEALMKESAELQKKGVDPRDADRHVARVRQAKILDMLSDIHNQLGAKPAEKIEIETPKAPEPEKPTVLAAAVMVEGDIYEGKNHAEAIASAKEDGQDVSKVDRDKDGLFILSDGSIINRDQAEKQFGARQSHELIPQETERPAEKPREERLKEAQSEHEKAQKELKDAEAKISKTQAEQGDIFGGTQSALFAAGREEAKAILDPLRAKVKETKAAVDKIEAEVPEDKAQTKLEIPEPEKKKEEPVKPQQSKATPQPKPFITKSGNQKVFKDAEGKVKVVDAESGLPARGTPESEAILDPLRKAVKEAQVAFDKAVSSKDKAKIKEAEKKLRSAKDKLNNTLDKMMSKATERKAIDEYASQYDFTAGEIAPEPKVEFSHPDEANQWLAENSNNPAEIAAVYIDEGPVTSQLSTTEQMIADYGGFKTHGKSYNDFGDRNNMNFYKARSYINKDAPGLDVIAKELSDHNFPGGDGTEITPEDLVAFMDRFPNGVRDAFKTYESDVAETAKRRFKELTGLELNQKTAEKAINQQYDKIGDINEQLLKDSHETEQQFTEDYFKSLDESAKEEGETGPATEPGSEKSAPEAPEKIAERAKEIADKIRAAADKVRNFGYDPGSLRSDISAVPREIIAKALEGIAKAVEAGGKIADAIKDAVAYIKANSEHKDDKDIEQHLRNMMGENEEKITEEAAAADKAAGERADTEAEKESVEFMPKSKETRFAKEVNDILDFADHEPEFTGDPHRDRRIISGTRDAMILRAENLIKSLQDKFKGDPVLQENVYHNMEDPSHPLTADEKEFRDTIVKPIQDALETVFKELTQANPDLVSQLHSVFYDRIGYVPREVKGKRGTLEKLIEGGKNAFGGGRLKKSSGHLIERKYGALTDLLGNRKVVIMKHGKMFEATKNALTDLGEYRGPRTLDDAVDIREKALDQIKYYPTKEKLENELNILTATKAREKAASARVRNIRDDLQRLEDIKSEFDNLYQETANYDALQKERDALMKQPPSAGRNAKVKGLDEQAKQIKAQMDKYFLDKQGMIHRVGDATVKEIESKTPTEYYKTPLANFLNAFIELKQVQMANAFLEKTKQTLQEDGLMHDMSTGKPPEGYTTTDLQNFRGYAFPKKIAAELNRLSAANKRDPALGLSITNTFLRNSIVFGTGIKHWRNEIDTWLKEGGISRFAHPYRLIKTGMQAAYAMRQMTPEYFEALEKGASLMSHNTQNYHQLLLDATLQQFKENKTATARISKILGYANPIKFMKVLADFSHKSAMASHDFLTLQAIFEHMDKGHDMRTSIDYVNKYIPDYDIPATVLGSEGLSKFLRNPNFTMFSAYHYGLFKGYANMIKDFAKSAKELDAAGIASATDKIAMQAVLSIMIYPMYRMVAGMLFTSDEDKKKGKTATVRTPGGTKVLEDIYRTAKGQKSIAQLIYGWVTPAQATELVVELAADKNWNPYSKDQPYLPSDVAHHPLEAAKSIGEFGIEKFNPAQTFSDVAAGKKSVKDVLEDQVDIQHSKSDEQKQYEFLKYEQNDVKSKVRQLIKDGKRDKAMEVWNDYLKDLRDASAKPGVRK